MSWRLQNWNFWVLDCRSGIAMGSQCAHCATRQPQMTDLWESAGAARLLGIVAQAAKWGIGNGRDTNICVDGFLPCRQKRKLIHPHWLTGPHHRSEPCTEWNLNEFLSQCYINLAYFSWSIKSKKLILILSNFVTLISESKYQEYSRYIPRLPVFTIPGIYTIFVLENIPKMFFRWKKLLKYTKIN